MYIACVDERKRDSIGIKTISNILQNHLGGWPVLQGTNWNGRHYNVWDQILKAYQIGTYICKHCSISFPKLMLKNNSIFWNLHVTGFYEDYIIDLDVRKYIKDNTRRVITMDQARLGLSKEYLDKGFNNPVVKAYFK